MPETPYVKFRFGPQTLADLDSLAASAGNRSDAIRECVAYWRAAVESAAAENASALTPAEWHLLAHTGTPATELMDDRYPDWSVYLAAELIGTWEGRPLVLPSHREEKKLSERLAKRIATWGPVRGYALMAAVRYFWRTNSTADAWWHPEIWLTPTTRETAGGG